MATLAAPKSAAVGGIDFVKDAAEHQRRLVLRRANLFATLISPLSPATATDANLKKHSGFIGRLRVGLLATSAPQFVADIKKLKLTKHAEECAAACVEGLAGKCTKAADAVAAVEVISLLHQRFPTEFTPIFVEGLCKVMRPPIKKELAALTAEQREREEKERIVRQRGLVRVIGELALVGVFYGLERDRKDAGILFAILKDLLADDSEHHNATIAVQVAKLFSREILDVWPRKLAADAAAVITTEHRALYSAVLSDPAPSTVDDAAAAFFSDPQRAAFTKILFGYNSRVCESLSRDHRFLHKLRRKNNEAAINRGELHEDARAHQERITKAYDKLLASAQSLTDALDKDMPDLPDEDADDALTMGLRLEGRVKLGDEDGATGDGIWEDEDARKFYEDLVDLKTQVPGILSDTSAKKHAMIEVVTEAPVVDDAPVDAVAPASEMAETDGLVAGTSILDFNEDEDSEVSNSDDDESEATVEAKSAIEPPATPRTPGVQPGPQFESVLASLLNVGNRDVIDQITIDFCYLNTKNARKRLSQVFIDVQRTRLDLLPFYSRMITTLYPFLPEIGDVVIAALEKEFRNLLRSKKRSLRIETRAKNIRFIGELTKFRIMPLHFVFHCLKALLDDFGSQSSVETLCAFLECCGRFLYKTPETHMRTALALEIMLKKKKTALNLDPRVQIVIDNAYFTCIPPERVARIEKVRGPLELFMRKIILSDLSKITVENTLKLLRKLPWDEDWVIVKLHHLLVKPWLVKYSNIHLYALLVAGLHRYHPEFGIGVVDRVLEDIRAGMESNNIRFNQKRVAIIRYLGELYNYRMVDSLVIFDTLYLLASFGHQNSMPAPGSPSPIDQPDDFFRARLICTMLETCGVYFDNGVHAKKLDAYLNFFQMYMLSKSQLPMEVDFMLADTFELLRPNLQRHKTYSDALNAVLSLLEKEKVEADALRASTANMIQEEMSESESDDAAAEVSTDNSEVSDSDSDDIEDGEIDEDAMGAAEPRVTVSDHSESSVEDDEDLLFEQGFNRMMIDSLESRRHEKKISSLDVAMPVNLSVKQEDVTADNQVKFTLLTKKAGKQQVKVVEVPAESPFALSAIHQQSVLHQEQQQLKKLVLEYEAREEELAQAQAQLRRQFRPVVLIIEWDAIEQQFGRGRGRGRGGGHRVLFSMGLN